MQPDKNFAEGLSLIPASIIALGAPAAPVERLIGLQSAIARATGWLASVRFRLPRLDQPASRRLRLPSQGDL